MSTIVEKSGTLSALKILGALLIYPTLLLAAGQDLFAVLYSLCDYDGCKSTSYLSQMYTLVG